ncbi:MAG: efflux RND transporter periplasmic adaptor subunit [Thermoanaerobaculia bacterium]
MFRIDLHAAGTDRMRMRRSLARGGLAAALLVPVLLCAAGCAAQPEPEAAPVQVATVHAERHDLAERLELPARLQPPAELDRTLASRVPGRIVALPVRLGEEIAAGTLLAEIEVAELAGETLSSAANLERARQEESARQSAAALSAKLFERGIVSSEERDRDAAAAAAASADRAEAESRVAAGERSRHWARIDAPFRGVVVELPRHLGETVDGTPAMPVVRLAGLERAEAVASATGEQLARVAPGAAAVMAVNAVAAPARIVRLARALDPTTGLGEVAALLDGPPPPPLFAEGRLEVVIALHRDALTLPASALRRGEQGLTEVVVVEGQAARVRRVEVGLVEEGRAEIVSGIDAGDAVIVDGSLGLVDGAAVATLPATAKP